MMRPLVTIRSGVAPALLLLVSFAAGARADNTTCAGATLVVPDGSLHEGNLAAGLGGGRWYRFVPKAGRSYALMAENLTPGDEQPEMGIVGIFDACGGALVSTNDFTDMQEPVSLDASFVGATREAIKATGDAALFFLVTHLDVSNAVHFRVRVEETTLFNPFWTTRGGLETYYQLFNTTNRHCSVTLDLRNNTNGIPNGGTNSITFDLAANTSVNRQTGAGGLNLQNGQSGHATLAHDCPPGAILVDAFLANAGGVRMLPLKMTTARQQR